MATRLNATPCAASHQTNPSPDSSPARPAPQRTATENFCYMTDPQVDIRENDIFELSPELLNALLKDHTLSTDTEQVNIFFGQRITMPSVVRVISTMTKSRLKPSLESTAILLCLVLSNHASNSNSAVERWPRCSLLHGYATNRTILSIMHGSVVRMFLIPKSIIPTAPTHGLSTPSQSFSLKARLGATM